VGRGAEEAGVNLYLCPVMDGSRRDRRGKPDRACGSEFEQRPATVASRAWAFLRGMRPPGGRHRQSNSLLDRLGRATPTSPPGRATLTGPRRPLPRVCLPSRPPLDAGGQSSLVPGSVPSDRTPATIAVFSSRTMRTAARAMHFGA